MPFSDRSHFFAQEEVSVLVQIERIANYHSITEPSSGSDRVQLASLKSQENQIFSLVDDRATGPGRYRCSVL